MSLLNLIKRETLSSSLGTSNPSTNIILTIIKETKLKIKDLKLFHGNRIKYKAFIYQIRVCLRFKKIFKDED